MGRREGPQASPRHQCRRRPYRGVGLVVDVVGFKGQIGFDTSRPRGTPRKLLDVSRPSANRANAPASTGPKTTRDRAHAAQNAFRAGV
jgi:hypothetical protein